MSFEGDYFKDIDVADSGKVERYVYLENDKEDATDSNDDLNVFAQESVW